MVGLVWERLCFEKQNVPDGFIWGTSCLAVTVKVRTACTSRCARSDVTVISGDGGLRQTCAIAAKNSLYSCFISVVSEEHRQEGVTPG